MDGNHLGIGVVHILVDADHGFPQRGVLLILPGGIIALVGNFRIVELCQFGKLRLQVMLFLVDGAAQSKGQLQLLPQRYDAQVQTGLHQAGNIRTPALDTVGSGIEQGDQLGAALGGEAVAAQSVHIVATDDGIGLIVLLPDLLLQSLRNIVDPLDIHAQGNQSHLAGTGNGVILGAALDLGDANGHELLDTAQELTHHLVGVGQFLVDLHTGVAATETLHGQTDTGTIDRTALDGHGDLGTDTTGAGHGEDALFLRVQIQHFPAPEHAQINACGTFHTGLLVHGDDHFQGGMGNGGVGEQGHGIGHRNAVITAQGGTLGKDIAAIVLHIQAFLLHINGAVRILLADHVHMTLEHHRLVVFIAGCSIAKEDHIVKLILDIAQVVFLCKGNQIVGNGLGVIRAMGNGTDFFKITEYSLRLQTRKFSRIHMHTPPLICIILSQ